MQSFLLTLLASVILSIFCVSTGTVNVTAIDARDRHVNQTFKYASRPLLNATPPLNAIELSAQQPIQSPDSAACAASRLTPDSSSLTLANGADSSILPNPVISFQDAPLPPSNDPIPVTIGEIISLSADKTGSTQEWCFHSAIVYRSFEKRACLPSPLHYYQDGCLDYGTVNQHSNKTEFYFVSPGRYIITYSYSLKGRTRSASANFNVDGPTFNDPSIVMAQVNLLPLGCSEECKGMDLGQFYPYSPLHDGVTVKTPSSDDFGKFSWVQTADNYVEFSDASGGHKCEVYEGLDGDALPYTYGDLTDTPWVSLKGLTGLTRSFFAQDTLMWMANLPQSVPVTVGSLTWSFSAKAAYVSNGDRKIWVLVSGTESSSAFRRGWFAVNWDAYFPPPLGAPDTSNIRNNKYSCLEQIGE